MPSRNTSDWDSLSSSSSRDAQTPASSSGCTLQTKGDGGKVSTKTNQHFKCRTFPHVETPWVCPYWHAPVLSSLHPNDRHDGINQWLVLINDPAKAVEERHGSAHFSAPGGDWLWTDRETESKQSQNKVSSTEGWPQEMPVTKVMQPLPTSTKRHFSLNAWKSQCSVYYGWNVKESFNNILLVSLSNGNIWPRPLSTTVFFVPLETRTS